jgi:hypothetical protein
MMLLAQMLLKFQRVMLAIKNMQNKKQSSPATHHGGAWVESRRLTTPPWKRLLSRNLKKQLQLPEASEEGLGPRKAVELMMK